MVKNIIESLDTKIDIKWEDFHPGFKGDFILNSIRYAITLTPLYDHKPLPNEQEYIKQTLGNSAEYFYDEGYLVEFYSIENGKVNYNLTNSIKGNGIKVISIVYHALIDLLTRESINNLFFSAKEDSRYSLYQRITSSIVNKSNLKLFSSVESRSFIITDANIKEELLKEFIKKELKNRLLNL